MSELWRPVINTFDVVTEGSFKLMDIILRDHASRCIKGAAQNPGVPVFGSLVSIAGTELGQWNAAYVNYVVARGSYKGHTQAFELLLAGLPLALDDWDIDIQAAGGLTRPYKAGKPAYTTLFPQGRKPFTSGARDQRVLTMQALSTAMTPEVPLAAVRTQVSAYAVDMQNKREQQQQSESAVETLSGQMELRRVSAADVLYGNLGLLMNHFRSKLNRPMIEKYFDLSYIRDGAAAPPDDAPPAPGDFTATAVSNEPNTVLTGWTLVPGAVGYRGYRRLPGEVPWTQMFETTAPPAIVNGQPVGVEMEWAVAGFNDAGEGPRSAPEFLTL